MEIEIDGRGRPRRRGVEASRKAGILERESRSSARVRLPAGRPVAQTRRDANARDTYRVPLTLV